MADADSRGALETLLTLCRRYGVLEFDGHGVKFTLAEMLAQDPTSVAPSRPQVMADQVEVLPEGDEKLGADGLSAEMQADLYDRPMDAKPGKKKE